MRPFPLTRATFLEYARARSENDSPFKDVAEATIELWCGWASDTIQSAMGDRIVPPLVAWDRSCEGHAVMLAWRPIMTARGYRKDAGRDSEITDLARQADEFCARLRAKQENPMFIDSSATGVGTRDAVIVVSSPSVEYWKANGACYRRRCC
jgi:hypothetical protein